MKILLAGLAELAFPPACAGCSTPLSASAQQALCARCDASIRHLPLEGCLCGQAPEAADPLPCTACAGTLSPLEACVAEVAFEGEAARWIRRFKFPRQGLAGLDPRPLALVAAWIRAAARRLPEAPKLVVPVPVTPKRLRTHGFHPAGELARALGGALGVRVSARTLAWRRPIRPQTGLGRRERERNVAGALVCVEAPWPSERDRIALVDDVVTTGATLKEAARALRRAGARHVVAVCAARTPAPP